MQSPIFHDADVGKFRTAVIVDGISYPCWKVRIIPGSSRLNQGLLMLTGKRSSIINCYHHSMLVRVSRNGRATVGVENF